VDKVKKASELFLTTYPNIESDWPLQIDAAIDTDVYIQKTKWKWRLTAPANILVFPTLDAGNMFYKNMERFGWYNAIGPILTGFKFPAWSDLSRGTSIQSIIDMAYVTALRSQGN
jgi:phosphate acetyltransferase